MNDQRPENKSYFAGYISRPLAVWAAVVALDQLTKHAVRAGIGYGETLHVLPFFQLTHLTNTGIAFSMFQGANAFFAAVTALALAGFAVWYAKNAPSLDGLLRAALVLVMSGAAGNLIDRIAFGHVTDFLDFYAGSWHWPAFNVADSCVSAGGALIFLWAIRPQKGKNVPNAD